MGLFLLKEMLKRKGKNMAQERMAKVGEEIKKELSKIITFDLKDPRITGMVSITKVVVTPDFKYAKVYISSINCKDKKELLKGFKNASGHLRSKISSQMKLRYTPELVFELDESMEYGAHISQVIEDVTKKLKS